MTRARYVLVVDDNLVNLRLVQKLLERQGHHVRVACNGREAVDLTAAEDFDVVLMDLQMPVMDGLEATRVIRARERESGAHLVIVALTATAMHGDDQACADAGMDGYLAKPIEAARLREAIDTLAR